MAVNDAVMQRVAELWTIKKHRELTVDENMEFCHAMNANARFWWNMAYLQNMSLIASMTNDVDYQHEVCLAIEMLQLGEKKKKPGPKDTD